MSKVSFMLSSPLYHTDHQHAKVFRRICRGEYAGNLAAGYDRNTVADRTQLLQLGRDHDDGDAAFTVEAAQGFQNQRLRADVDTAGRLGYEEELRLEREGFGEAHLLLVAAGQLPRFLLGADAFDFKLVYVALRDLTDGLLVAPFDKAAEIVFQKLVLNLHGREGHVPFQRLVQQQADAAPILRHEGQGRIETFARAVERDLLALEDDLTARLVKAHNPVGDTELALSRETADAEDLAFLDIQAHITNRFARHVHPKPLDGHGSPCVGMIPNLNFGGGSDASADHTFRNLTDIGAGRGDVGDHEAVAHDDDPVADGKDLVQSVRDEDNRDAAFGHGANGIEQRLGLLLGQNGGRLIQDQELELILAELARDLRKLLVADGHFADDHVLVDGEAHLVDGGLRPAGHFIVIEGVQSLAEHLGNHIFPDRLAV